jgi:iron complex outermembrane recepter protein
MGVICPAGAWAQSAQPASSAGGVAADESSAPALGEVVVTAQKRSESLNRVGITATAYSGEELREQGISSVEDIARITPGLSFANTQTNTPVYTLRGVGFNDNSLSSYPDVSVYVDEVPLPFPALTGQVGLDLERVEVLKGPQGILFGTNATGGAINYIAAKPTDTFQAGGQVSFSRFNTLDTEGYVSGPLTENLLARVSAKVLSGGDWQTSDTRDDTLGARNAFAARLLLDWAPSTFAKFELNLNGWRNQSDPQAPQYVELDPEQPAFVQQSLVSSPFASSNDRSTDWAPDQRPRADDAMYQVDLRGDIKASDDITITSISSYIGYTRDDLVNADGVATDLNSYTAVGSIHTFFQELRAANSGSDRLRWVAGGNYEHSNVVDNDFEYYPGSSSFTALGISENYFSSRQELRNYAAFGDVAFDIAEPLSVKSGVRYTRNDRSVSSCNSDGGDGDTNALFTKLAGDITGTVVAPLSVGQCFPLTSSYLPIRTPFEVDLNQSNVSWQAGVDYKPSATGLVYANVTKGYKAGTFPTLSASTVTEEAAATQESVLDYEVGGKFQLLDKKLYLTGAAFFYDYHDKQVLGSLLDPVFGVEPVLINVPKSFVKGGEAALAWAPITGLSSNLSMTYIDTRVTDYVGYNSSGQMQNLAGSQLPFSPRWSGILSTDYTRPLRGDVDGFVGGNVSARSRQTTLIGANTEEYTNAYFLLDLRAGIQNHDGRWRVSVWGKNVLDKYYWNNVVRESDNTVRYTGFPATFGITLSARFE